MATWDLVFAYNEDFADLLRDAGCLHPPTVRPGNRLPSAGETRKAISALCILEEHPMALAFDCHDDDFDWNDDSSAPQQCYVMRGELVLALRLLVRLAADCGQFFLCSGSGLPGIVVDASLNPERAVELFNEAITHQDSWKYFCEEMSK